MYGRYEYFECICLVFEIMNLRSGQVNTSYYILRVILSHFPFSLLSQSFISDILLDSEKIPLSYHSEVAAAAIASLTSLASIIAIDIHTSIENLPNTAPWSHATAGLLGSLWNFRGYTRLHVGYELMLYGHPHID